MSLFELLSYTDDEVDLIAMALNRWSERNHVNLQSERGWETLRVAVALVSSGIKAPEEIDARLNEHFTGSTS